RFCLVHGSTQASGWALLVHALDDRRGDSSRRKGCGNARAGGRQRLRLQPCFLVVKSINGSIVRHAAAKSRRGLGRKPSGAAPFRLHELMPALWRSFPALVLQANLAGNQRMASCMRYLRPPFPLHLPQWEIARTYESSKQFVRRLKIGLAL